MHSRVPSNLYTKFDFNFDFKNKFTSISGPLGPEMLALRLALRANLFQTNEPTRRFMYIDDNPYALSDSGFQSKCKLRSQTDSITLNSSVQIDF